MISSPKLKRNLGKRGHILFRARFDVTSTSRTGMTMHSSVLFNLLLESNVDDLHFVHTTTIKVMLQIWLLPRTKASAILYTLALLE